ncbi:MAG: hypothetical protein K2X52_17230 [Mycobacteriaceae bacterium]|nr:hypothetical protein [Mycolicibacterium sp. GF69]MBY0288862.1 hypothetical protein [Mycobacteriaceae bacterium]
MHLIIELGCPTTNAEKTILDTEAAIGHERAAWSKMIDVYPAEAACTW